MKVSQKHNVTRQSRGLRDHKCLDLGGRHSEQSTELWRLGRAPQTPNSKISTPDVLNTTPPPLGPHFPQSFSRLFVLIFTDSAPENPTGPLQHPPNMAASDGASAGLPRSRCSVTLAG